MKNRYGALEPERVPKRKARKGHTRHKANLRLNFRKLQTEGK